MNLWRRVECAAPGKVVEASDDDWRMEWLAQAEVEGETLSVESGDGHLIDCR